MGLTEFLQNIFCEELVSDLREAEEVIHRLDFKIGVITTNFNTQKELYQKLVEKSVLLQNEKDALTTVSEKLKVENLQLTEMVADAIILPDLTQFTEPRETVNSFELDYPVSIGAIGDNQYYTFTYDNWIEILRRCQPNVKAVLHRWRRNLSDCENWSSLMHAIVTGTIARTGIDLQGLFAVANSNTHSYNAFLDTNGDWWVYEPLTDKVKGELGATGNGYDTKRIFLMG